MKKELISKLSLSVTILLAGFIMHRLGYDKGYMGGYEDAVERLESIYKKTDKETRSIDTCWTLIPTIPGMDTVVFHSSIKHIRIKLMGSGEDRMKIHAYFPKSDSTWSHYIVEE